MSNTRVGVIGVGVLGNFHAKLYQNIDDADLVGIYDANPERAAEIAAAYGCAAFDDITTLCRTADAVSIAVPTDQHFDVAQKALAAGSHVLVEKPITATSAEGERLVRQAKDLGLVLQVGHVERFNPVITYLEKHIQHPRFIEAHRLASFPPPRVGMLPRGTEVGVVLDLMIHDIDIILHLVRSEVVQVDTVGIPVLSKTEDIANARLQFSCGCVANLTASRVSQEPVRKIRVFQEDGYLSLDYQERKGEMAILGPAGVTRQEVPIHDHNALLQELVDFVAAVRSPAHRPAVTGQHGLNALRIAEQITRQIAEA